jgi:hypothetical protein
MIHYENDDKDFGLTRYPLSCPTSYLILRGNDIASALAKLYYQNVRSEKTYPSQEENTCLARPDVNLNPRVNCNTPFA